MFVDDAVQHDMKIIEIYSEKITCVGYKCNKIPMSLFEINIAFEITTVCKSLCKHCYLNCTPE